MDAVGAINPGKGDRPLPSVRADQRGPGQLTLGIDGHLDSTTTGEVWRKAVEILEQTSPADIAVDATGIDYCDGSGIGMLVDLGRRQKQAGGSIEI